MTLYPYIFFSTFVNSFIWTSSLKVSLVNGEDPCKSTLDLYLLNQQMLTIPQLHTHTVSSTQNNLFSFFSKESSQFHCQVWIFPLMNTWGGGITKIGRQTNCMWTGLWSLRAMWHKMIQFREIMADRMLYNENSEISPSKI